MTEYTEIYVFLQCLVQLQILLLILKVLVGFLTLKTESLQLAGAFHKQTRSIVVMRWMCMRTDGVSE